MHYDYSRKVIKVSGDDATKFLQGLTTNLISENNACYSLLLSPQGRYWCDFFVIPIDGAYLLSVAGSAKDRLLQRLKTYKMRSRVEIAEETRFHTYSREHLGGIAFKDPRHPALGYWSITDDEFKDDAGNFYKLDKYNLTIPEGEIDMLLDKALPPEFGVDLLNGISYTKGCYVGQEVMARAKYQGVVRKKVYRVDADFDLSSMPYGSEIVFEEQKIGVITSGFGNIGIALIREQEGVIFNEAYIDSRIVSIQPAAWYT